MEKNTAPQTTVADYLRWRGDLGFDRDPFNEVDNLVLCIIAYLNFRRFPALRTRDASQAVPIGEIAPQMTAQDEQQGLSPNDYVPLMQDIARTARFSGVKLFGYETVRDAEKEMQLDAISFLVPDGSLYCAFMGTDTSLVGWKENMNLSFMDAVPAQVRAASYVEEMAEACPERTLRVGGHSKGGNLASWASLHMSESLQAQRLTDVYNNDGPGFNRAMAEMEAYDRIEPKLHTYIPESSIVGVLLEHTEDYAVIDSVGRSVMQHEPLTWCVVGNHFVHLGQRSEVGKLSDEVLREWISSLSVQEREDFSAAMFDIFTQGGKVQDLKELKKEGFPASRELLRRLMADQEERGIVTKVLGRLVSDFKEELLRTAGDGLRDAKEGLAETADSLLVAGQTLLESGKRLGVKKSSMKAEKKNKKA